MEKEMELSSFSVLSTFILLIFITIINKLKTRNSFSNNVPPGPWKLPLIGNMHQLLCSLPHRRLRDLAKIYGPIMQLQLGQVSALVISSSELAKQVLKTQEINFLDRPRVEVANILFYNRQDIAFAPYGDYWRQIRKISISGLFSSSRVKYYRSIREEEVSKLVRFIFSRDGEPINFSRLVFSLVNGIIARTTMGNKCGKQEDFNYIVEALTKAVGGFSIVDLLPSLKILHLICGTRARLERVRQEADKILENIIQELLSSNEASENGDEKEKNNLLDVLLDLQDHGNHEFPLTMDSIKAVLLDMISAGSDTSTATLEWAMSELLRNPRLMTMAQEEVRQVFNNQNGNFIDENSLEELKFLKAVVRETLRLHPPTPMFPRECKDRCEINGYDIPAKTEVLINICAIGRDPRFWTKPETFDPERFLDSSESVDYKGINFEFLPFGAGKRMCPGMLLGMANAELPLACLLYYFDWKLASGEELEHLDMSEAFGAVTIRKSDLYLIPIPFYPAVLSVKS